MIEKKSSIFFDRKIFRSKKIDETFFGHFFFREPISIPNFPKIPKITLRKLCDEAWYTSSGDLDSAYFFVNSEQIRSSPTISS